MSDTKKFKLSSQAMASLMLVLQRSLLEQSDIVPVLETWELVDTPNGLVVGNPPIIHDANIEENTPESAIFEAWADQINPDSSAQ
tara:strand:+ start:148 stop:402 length:255 start_codon:yes stop_codon:yes gene_type:complete